MKKLIYVDKHKTILLHTEYYLDDMKSIEEVSDKEAEETLVRNNDYEYDNDKEYVSIYELAKTTNFEILTSSII